MPRPINGRGRGWAKGLKFAPKPGAIRPQCLRGKRTWNPKAKPQPEREGQVWELFSDWWKDQDIEKQRISIAWKGFYAAYTLKDLFK